MLFKLRDMSNFVWLSRVAAGVGAGVAPLNAVTAPFPFHKRAAPAQIQCPIEEGLN